MSTRTVVPVVNNLVENKEAMEQVTVTILKDKEIGAILTIETKRYIDLALKLQDDKENPSVFAKTAIEDAMKNFLKAQCSLTVAKWDNLVKKIAATPRYASSHNYKQVEAILKDNPKVKWLYAAAIEAATIKKNL